MYLSTIDSFDTPRWLWLIILEISLKQIYGPYNRAVPNLRAYAEPLMGVIVAFYLASQKRFTTDIRAHYVYVYSPRGLTRWIRGTYETICFLKILSVEGLVCGPTKPCGEYRRSCLGTPPNKEGALNRPILFSNWISMHYILVDAKHFMNTRKPGFVCSMKKNLMSVLFNGALDHVLRIDHVFRQIQSHLLLIGVSGSGKVCVF